MSTSEKLGKAVQVALMKYQGRRTLGEPIEYKMFMHIFYLGMLWATHKGK